MCEMEDRSSLPTSGVMRVLCGKWPGPTPCMATSWHPAPMTGKSLSGRRRMAPGRRRTNTRDTTPQGQWEVKKINNAHTIGCNAVSWAPAVVPGSLIDQPSGQKPNYIKKFASGGCDNLIKLWKEEEDGQWKEEQKLEAHSDWVRDVAWAPSIGLPTSTIASCSQDGRVFIWTCDDTSGNTWSPKLLHKFNDVVWHVSWSITANILAVSGGDNKVTLWKESVDGQWVCISDVNKGQGSVSASITEGQQNEQ
uniref:protein SEC13 homolog isoform X7 n=1 Tax=Odobenus rosmarus divergens TaxID=9708 RepID=UPI00063C4D2D|nr:PREDICTED: protein SEC13 homolog isoform X7 [Odobenus rosmarus divergens]